MPFTVITGSFHLVGRTASGNASGFEPDGDSIQFKPTDPGLLERLDRVGRPVKLTAIGSTQLRFEGIDALELHFGGSHQPRALADEAREFLTGLLELNPVPYRPPELVRVQPPVEKGCRGPASSSRARSRRTAARSRSRSRARRRRRTAPSCSSTPALLEQSLNYRSLANGHAHPLFYDTLFVDLRDALSRAAIAARERPLGLWDTDRSRSGLAVAGQADLERHGVVFPKLFRRLTEFLSEGHQDLDGFLDWVAAKREQLLDLPANNFTHFDNVLTVSGDEVRLTRRPEEIVFVSAKSASPKVAPWLAV